MMSSNQPHSNEIVPWACIYLDTTWENILRSMNEAFLCLGNRIKMVENLSKLWRSPLRNHALPCLSVRSGLDLFLRVKHFPEGSQIIMTALNIPDMVRVVKHHGMIVIPLDIKIDDMAPKIDHLELLITDKTVAIIVAHIYGKWIDMNPIIEVAQRYNLSVLEDCAESFCGLEKLGDPRSDLVMFSFGTIKFCTAFGGAVLNIRDIDLYRKMNKLHETYPCQKQTDYFTKILKMMMVLLLLNSPKIVKPAMFFTRTFNIDHKKRVIELIRGFPDNLIHRLRQKPSTALLAVMWNHLRKFNAVEFGLMKSKCDYVAARLPDTITLVGSEAVLKNYWLFPILVESPNEFLENLFAMGIDAYRGATQLNVVEPNIEKSGAEVNYLKLHYPYEAKYLIDHVIYLPVNKFVPFYYLDQICKCVALACYKNVHSRRTVLTIKPKSKL
ncbi:uncharacterized protein LOC141915120 isoform X2 [Tubulanus polymorphus]|uniref:uncharacterized protein LOC141915120 isoform X2 n=1 Tax=Tubulanus polymorphus TaxID=672921 RepID=UPI003DA559F4